MAQLTKQDIADVIEKVLDRKLDEKLDEKLGAFVEHLDDKFDRLAEAISIMNINMRDMAKQGDLMVVKDDVATIKFAVKETNKDLRKLECRFDKLEDHFDKFERACI